MGDVVVCSTTQVNALKLEYRAFFKMLLETEETKKKV
jgi:hypothetical protein